MENVNVFMACKLMPHYRIGVFHQLTKYKDGLKFYFFGDTKDQGGIKQINYEHSNKCHKKYIRWIKTKNLFYKPERLLWQTGVIKEIFKPKFKVFVFEGAIAHYPIWLYALLCKMKGKKVLFWTHGDRGIDKGIKKILRVVLFKWLSDGLLLYGNYQRNNMITDGYNPKKLSVIYNSLDSEEQFKILKLQNSDKIRKKKKEIFLKPELFTLIFIGRLVKHKGVANIIEAVKILSDNGNPINCIFIGGGQEYDGLLESTSNKDLKEQIYFTGELYKEDQIAKYFSMVDLMISPGNVGLNCIHSLAYGIPVLTHDNFDYQNPEVEAIINGKTGIFYKYGFFEDLIKTLENWIKSRRNSNIIKTNCQKRIRELYNPTIQANCIVNAVKKSLI